MLDSLTNKQKNIVIIVGITVTILVTYFIYQKLGKNDVIQTDDEILIMQNITKDGNISDTENEEEERIFVHIAGAVNLPGIVDLKQGERVKDSTNKAGGLTEKADISKVNLAFVLEDGVKIVIPEKGEANEENNLILDNSIGDEKILQEDSKSENKTLKININKATQSELEELSGVGPSLASKIIEYRNNKGKFSSIEDIKNVSGIGENKYEAINDYICIN